MDVERVGIIEGDGERTARLLGAVETSRERYPCDHPAENDPQWRWSRETARSLIGEARFQQSWEAGRKMSVMQSVEYALDE